MAFHRRLSKLTKGGSTNAMAGKGSQQAQLPARQAMAALQGASNPTMNDYAKLDPQSQPAGTPDASSGIGSGDWDGDLG